MKKIYEKVEVKLTWNDDADIITASAVIPPKDDNETTPVPLFTGDNFS